MGAAETCRNVTWLCNGARAGYWTGLWTVAQWHGQHDDLLGCISCGELVDWLRSCIFLKEDSAVRSYLVN